MAGRNSPQNTMLMADSVAQSTDAQGTPATVPANGNGTDWLTGASAPNIEHSNVFDPPHKTLTPLDSRITEGVDQVATHFRLVFQDIRTPVDYILNNFQQLLLSTPAPVAIIVLILVTWQISGVEMGMVTLAPLIAIGVIGTWSQTVVTLAPVLTALLFYIVIGLPLGTWLAKSPRAAKVIRPPLGTMQITPTFIYLVPTVMLFSTGSVPDVVVTVIFALPSIIHLTTLGTDQVPADLIEALHSSGAGPRWILFKVQLSLTAPTIVVSVNQTLVLALSMVVVISIITVDGLGQMALRGIGRLDTELATVGGIGIVILAIILDRLTQAVGCDSHSCGNHRWYATGPVGLLTRPFIEQLCICLMTPDISPHRKKE